MTQTERDQVFDNPSLITTWKLGSILSGGGSAPTQNNPTAWADMVDRFQAAALATRLHIPILYGIDSVHGDGNMYGATVFPHNIGLGATRDPALVERGRARRRRGDPRHRSAVDVRAVHLRGPRRPLGPYLRELQRGPDLVTPMETAIDGLQGRRPPVGQRPGARDGQALRRRRRHRTTAPRQPARATRSTRASDHEPPGLLAPARRPYVPAVQRTTSARVMPSFSSVDWTEDGVGNPIKMHDNRRADHRRCSRAARLRRLRHQRLGGHPPDPGRLADSGARPV